MESFKIGDKVKYISNKYVDRRRNPLWGGKYGYIKGVVEHIDGVSNHECDRRYYVRWDNGIRNVYINSDLKIIPTLPESLFEL